MSVYFSCDHRQVIASSFSKLTVKLTVQKNQMFCGPIDNCRVTDAVHSEGNKVNVSKEMMIMLLLTKLSSSGLDENKGFSDRI